MSTATLAVQARIVATMSPLAEGIMLGLFGLTLLASRILIGILNPYFSRKFFLLTGHSLAMLGNGAALLAPDTHVALFVMRMLFGAAAAFWIIDSTTYVEESGAESPEKIRRSMGEISATHGIGVAFSLVVGGLFVQYIGWHAPFLIGLIAATTAFFLILRMQEPERRSNEIMTAKIEIKPFISMLHSPRLLAISTGGALIFFILTATVWGFSQNFAQESLGAVPWQLSLLAGAMGIPYAFGMKFFHRVQRRLGYQNTLIFSFFFAGAAVVSTPFMPNTYALAILYFVIGGSFGVAYGTLMAKSIEGVAVVRWILAMAVFQTLYSLGFFLGPNIWGFLATTVATEYLFYAYGSVAIIGAASLLLTSFISAINRGKEQLRTQA